MQSIVITEFLGAQTVSDAAGSLLEMENRFAAALVIPFNGCIRFTEAGRHSITADVRSPVFLPEGATYRNECRADAESLLINFRTTEAYPHILPLSPLPPEEALAYRNRLALLQKRYGAGTKQELFALLYSLLARLLKPSDTAPPPPEEAIIPAIEAALAGYANPAFSCAEMAHAANLSEAYMRRLFLRHTGLSPFRYLTKLRMDQAACLIRAGRRVGEVARSVGYGDVYQFSRAYKRHFGYAPSETAKE